MSGYFKTFLRGSAVSLAGALLLGVINFLTRRLLCIELSVADYGVFYGVFSFYSLIFCFSDLGLTQAGTVMITEANQTRNQIDKVFSCLFFLKFINSVICSGIVILFYQFRNHSIEWLIILLFAGLFIAKTLCGAMQSLWNGQKKYTIQQCFYLLTAVLTYLSLLLLKKISLLSTVFFFSAVAVVTLVSGLLYSQVTNSGRLRMKISGGICKKLLSAGGMIAVSTTLISAMYHMDTVMLNMLQSSESVGLYNAALPIMQIVQVGMVFPSVFLPIAVEMNKNREYTKLLSSIRYFLLAAVLLIVPFGLFFYFTSDFLICLLFDARYKAAAEAVPILCVGLLLFTSGSFFLQIMVCLNKLKQMALIALITASGNVIMNYYFIKKLGFCGAAYATLASYTVLCFLCYISLEIFIRKLKNQ